MAGFPWGSLISTAGSFISGLGGESSADRNAAARVASRKDYQRQQEILKSQVQWRVEDARKAGIHPLAALGLPAAGGVGSSSNVFGGSDSGVGDAVGAGLQTLGSAISGREAAANARELSALQKEQLRANIDLTRARSRTLIKEGRANAIGGTTGAAMFDIGGDKYMPGTKTSAQQAEDWGWEFGGAIQALENIQKSPQVRQKFFSGSGSPKLRGRIIPGSWADIISRRLGY